MADLKTISGKALGRVCFGAMQFGKGSDADVSQSIFEKCVSLGINHFDTAWVYNEGQSETLLGRFARTIRDDVFIATKVGYTGGASPANLQKQFDASRQRLQLDQVDILYLHRFDPDFPLNETLNWFAKQKDQGAVRHIGVSNFAAWQIVHARAMLESIGASIDVAQPMYSLVKRQAEVEILPACHTFDISCFSYSPLGAGLLTGKYSGNGFASGRLSYDQRYARRYSLDQMHKTAQDLVELSASFGLATSVVAILWVLQSKFCPTPIVSARNIEQLDELLPSLDRTLSNEQLRLIEEISPRPAPATDRLEEQD
ncbi:MAG: aldo/keto reductase [Rhodobacteraceae bacterium]|jgi:aryl-alcohol dehydrogenase-like predicted oxidoreductase|nr:aldo/keto reductase [Paracoccaceae bacterium]